MQRSFGYEPSENTVTDVTPERTELEDMGSKAWEAILGPTKGDVTRNRTQQSKVLPYAFKPERKMFSDGPTGDGEYSAAMSAYEHKVSHGEARDGEALVAPAPERKSFSSGKSGEAEYEAALANWDNIYGAEVLAARYGYSETALRRAESEQKRREFDQQVYESQIERLRYEARDGDVEAAQRLHALTGATAATNWR